MIGIVPLAVYQDWVAPSPEQSLAFMAVILAMAKVIGPLIEYGLHQLRIGW